MVPLVVAAILLFWYPITTKVHEEILQEISERVYPPPSADPNSVAPVLDPVRRKLLVTKPKQDRRTQFLNHFASGELGIWLYFADAGYRTAALWMLRLSLLLELSTLMGAIGCLIYLVLTSLSFPLFLFLFFLFIFFLFLFLSLSLSFSSLLTSFFK